MPNVKLTKHDGQHLVTGADNVRSIVSLDRGGPARPDGALCVVTTDFRGVSTFALGMTAREAREAIDASRKTKKGLLKITAPAKVWLELEAGQDVTFLEPGSVVTHEGFPAQGDNPAFIRVHYRRHDGEVVCDDISATDGNLRKLDEDMEQGA